MDLSDYYRTSISCINSQNQKRRSKIMKSFRNGAVQSFTTNKESENSVHVSYLIAEKIGKSEKPFADGEFVKECLQSAADVICPSQEELASGIELKGTTQGTDLNSSLTLTLDKCELDFSNVSAITTDGAKSMTGEKIGVTTLLKSNVKVSGNNTVMTFQCIIHQENLCKKPFSNFEHVMNIVVKVVNFIRSKGLHRQFQQFLSDLEAEYGDAVNYAEVLCLSRGKMLQRLFSLKSEVQQFMESKRKSIHEFSVEKWLRDFAFLVDIIGHLSNLNYRLLREESNVHNLYYFVNAFEAKLIVWESQLLNKNSTHFPKIDGVFEELYNMEFK
ncbi:general transcription factor II-I repeat domain-containing protein 2-like [Stegodyphus dumicola]|uniref:general transcription factor II-I repeat domain-containing protein 2-like n=1 Tax=Stegodyphus dumicola TaxID=202533 RepID=UPI0015AD021B|nr:general transcription factor II-I repeat domain-containing protein 2-like [Stegodyphus dumicola]